VSLKILIRTPNHLGDCMMALPMINETREAYPGASITVLTPQHLVELLHKNPGVDEILTIPTEYVHGWKAVFRVRDIIAPGDFDIGYILPPSFGAASGFKLAGVKERIGYIADGRRMLLTKPLPLPEPLNSEHRSIVYFNLLRRSSGAALEYVKPKLFLDEEDIQRATELLKVFNLGEADRYAVLAFRAVAASRRWGIANYGALAHRLVGRFGLRVLLTGTSDDARDGDRIVEELAPHVPPAAVVNLAGKTSLRELATIFSRATVFVGNDSGPAHLAAAVGAPVVVLSGADDPKETSPMSAQKRLLYAAHLDCISCVKNKCPLKGEQFMRCMTEITLDMVQKEVVEIAALGTGAAGTAPA